MSGSNTIVSKGSQKASKGVQAPKSGTIQKVGIQAPVKDKHEAPVAAPVKTKKASKPLVAVESAKSTVAALDAFYAVLVAQVAEAKLSDKNRDPIYKVFDILRKRVLLGFKKAEKVASKGDKNARKKAKMLKLKAQYDALCKELEVESAK